MCVTFSVAGCNSIAFVNSTDEMKMIIVTPLTKYGTSTRTVELDSRPDLDRSDQQQECVLDRGRAGRSRYRDSGTAI